MHWLRKRSTCSSLGTQQHRQAASAAASLALPLRPTHCSSLPTCATTTHASATPYKPTDPVLQVERVLLEGLLGPHAASPSATAAPAAPDSVRDLIRGCLGRVNCAEASALQEAVEALRASGGNAYPRLMSLVVAASLEGDDGDDAPQVRRY